MDQFISSLEDFLLGGIGGLIAAYLSYRFGVRRDLEKLKAELDQSIKRGRVEKLLTISDELWSSVQVALERSAVLTASYKQYPDFQYMGEEEVAEFLKTSFMSDLQKRKFLESNDRNDFYMKARFHHELAEARESLYHLNAEVRSKKIHIPENLASNLHELISTLNGLFISYEMWHDYKDPQLMKRAREEIKESKELSAIIEKQIRAIVNQRELST